MGNMPNDQYIRALVVEPEALDRIRIKRPSI